jgi:enamine deaminase RidA (YjgF/YER057c/UK114 family)
MTITMNTRTIPLITFAFAIYLFTGIASQRSYSQERKAVNLSPTRGLPFSDGIVVGDTLYVAGQEGTDESNKLAAGGIGRETTAALQNIQKVLKARRCSKPPVSN